MIFWAGILIAVLFAISAIKLGFYHAWTMLFNLVVAAYVTIRLGPFLEYNFSSAASGQYTRTLWLLATGMGTFLILQGIAYVLLIGQFEVTFPRAINIIGSGLLGFAAGFLVWSFGTFLFCTTPMCQSHYVKEIGFDTKTFEEAKMQPYLIWWCNFLDKFVGSSEESVPVDKVIKEILTKPVIKAVPDANSIRPGIISEPNGRTGRPPAPTAPEPNSEIPP